MIELCDSCRVERAAHEIVSDPLSTRPKLFLSCTSRQCRDFSEIRGLEESRSGCMWTQPIPTPRPLLAVPPVPCLEDVSCL